MNQTNLPYNRKSPRAFFHDYSGGCYFITICTENKNHYFGKIENGIMIHSQIGKYCCLQLESISSHYPYAETLLYVVMPNHLHAIIHVDGDSPTTLKKAPPFRTNLSVIIGGLKQAVTMFARKNNIEFSWQSRYHDHIIRNSNDGNKIAKYIENNVAAWQSDCFY